MKKLIKTKGRKKPYSEIGITRMECSVIGCGNQAKYQWEICSDNNLWRTLCSDCDIMVNEMFLKLIDVDYKKKIVKYIKLVRRI